MLFLDFLTKDTDVLITTYIHHTPMSNTTTTSSISVECKPPLAESTGYIKIEGMQIFYFDLDVTFTLMCDLDLINDL